jgi:hypothetical protein
MTIDIAAVTAAYIETLLWSESCNGTAPTDDGHEHTTTDPQNCDASLERIGFDADDLADSARKEIEDDVLDFVESNAADISSLIDAGKCDEGDIGHNFLLTGNHHGAGFWDRGFGVVGDRLTEASDPYGTMSAYVGDDGKVYVQG